MSFLLNYLPWYNNYNYYYLDQKSLSNIMKVDSTNVELKQKIINLAKKVGHYSSLDDSAVAKKICDDLADPNDNFVAVAKEGNCLAFLYLSQGDKRTLEAAKGTCNKVEINNVIIDGDNCDNKTLFIYAIGYALKKLVLGGKNYEIEYKLQKTGDNKHKIIVECLKKFGFTLSNTYMANLLYPWPQTSEIELWTLNSPFNIWSDLVFDRYISWPNEISIW